MPGCRSPSYATSWRPRPRALGPDEAPPGTYGYNELPEEKTNPLLEFLSYFWGPIPWMIEGAVILSALVQGNEAKGAKIMDRSRHNN